MTTQTKTPALTQTMFTYLADGAFFAVRASGKIYRSFGYTEGHGVSACRWVGGKHVGAQQLFRNPAKLRLLTPEEFAALDV